MTNEVELTTTNASGINIPLREEKILRDYIRKDGIRIIKYKKDVYKNGYSAWKGTKDVILWRVVKDGRQWGARTRKEALKHMEEELNTENNP